MRMKFILSWKVDGYTYTRLFVTGLHRHTLLQGYIDAAQILKSDFPGIKDADIDIGKIRNASYMYGYQVVSALLPDGTEVPPDYIKHPDTDFDW